MRYPRTHIEEIVDSTVRVVEAGSEGTHDLVTLETHRHDLQHGLLISLARHQQSLGFRQRAGRVCHGRRRRCRHRRRRWLRRHGSCCRSGRPWWRNGLGRLRLRRFGRLLGSFWLRLYTVKAVSLSVLFGNKNVPVHTSNTGTETACLKLIFAKFACSITKVPVHHAGAYCYKKSTGHCLIHLSYLFSIHTNTRCLPFCENVSFIVRHNQLADIRQESTDLFYHTRIFAAFQFLQHEIIPSQKYLISTCNKTSHIYTNLTSVSAVQKLCNNHPSGLKGATSKPILTWKVDTTRNVGQCPTWWPPYRI